MSIEKTKNRDLFIKTSFMYFLIYILKILGIDEEVEEVKTVERISLEKKKKFKLFNNFLDYVLKMKSKKIYLFEFKKGPITKDDLKQACNYSRRLYCDEKTDIITIIITISKKGNISEYAYIDNTFHPKIIKTKTISRQKDLKVLRDKFKSNKKLTLLDCALVITLPLFELAESEAEIVREMCRMLKNKRNLFPDSEIDGLVIGMYLNIIEYLDEDEQEEYEEMIDVATSFKGIRAELKEEGIKEGIKEGKKEGKREGKKEIRDLLQSRNLMNKFAALLEMTDAEVEGIFK